MTTYKVFITNPSLHVLWLTTQDKSIAMTVADALLREGYAVPTGIYVEGHNNCRMSGTLTVAGTLLSGVRVPYTYGKEV